MLMERICAPRGWLFAMTALPRFASSAFDLVLASAAINVLALAVPIAVMQVFDRIIPNSGTDTLVWLAGGAALALIIEGVLRWVRGTLGSWLGARFEHRLACEAVYRLLTCRLEDFERDGVGAHMDRLGVVSTLASLCVAQLFQIFLDLPFVALMLAALYFLAGDLALFPAGVALIYLVLMAVFRRWYERSRLDQSRTNDQRFNFIIELLGGMHLIKAQTFEELMMRRYERLQTSTAEVNMAAAFWGTLPGNLGGLLMQVTTFGFVVLGCGAVIDGSMTVGALSAGTMLAGRVLQPFQNLIGYWFRFTDARIARSRLQEIAALRGEVESGMPAFPGDIDGTIDLADVSFRHRPDLPWVLKDLNLRITAGSFTAITATGGAGTTTLLSLIMGTLTPEHGSVFIDDYNVAEWNHANLRGRVEYVAPTGTLFKGTILDNIALFNPDQHRAALEAAALLGLDEPIALLPKGYETPVDGLASQLLPSGLIQRICIARALTLRPRILLFDKVSAAMDKDSEAVFLWLLERLKGRCTLVVISNQPPVLALADTVVELRDGAIVTGVAFLALTGPSLNMGKQS